MSNPQMEQAVRGEFAARVEEAMGGWAGSTVPGFNDVKPNKPRVETLLDQVHCDRIQTFVVQNLSRTTTTDAVIGELEQLGCGDFDFLRMPISNGDQLFRGFAVINFSDPAAASRFIYAVEGRVFAGGSERALVEIGVKQGVMANLDAINWTRRRRKNTHVCDKRGAGANGAPFVRLGGQLRQILTHSDVEAARIVYG